MPAHDKNDTAGLTAEILAIGTELLLGEIVDTNTRAIARALRETGIDLFRTMTVGDNTDRIAEALKDSFQRADVVITTGGLGPTIDDVTRQGVARAFALELEYHSSLWLQIEQRFQRFHRSPTENNRRQAMLPTGALAVENPIGTAPGFILSHNQKTVIALPGVPAEMVYLLEHEVIPYLKERTQTGAVILPRVLHLAGVGESWVDERIQDLEESSNPTVGLAAHPGLVDIRITAKAGTAEAAGNMLDEMEAELRSRLGAAIYGIDDSTLAGTLLHILESKDVNITLFTAGMGSEIADQLAPHLEREGAITDPEMFSNEQDLKAFITGQHQDAIPGVVLLAALDHMEDRSRLQLGIQMGGSLQVRTLYFGGADSLTQEWALHQSLDFLRRQF